MGIAIKKIFAKDSSLGFRAFSFLLLSLILFICDHRYHCFVTLRTILSFVTAPIQYTVNLPAEIVNTVSTSITNKQALVEENSRLHAELLVLRAQLQRLNFLQQENVQLRTLLSSAQSLHTKALAAQLLAVAADNFSQQLTINKGKKDGLYVGQPVLDAYGVMGQVILVGAMTSKILLITDHKSAVPVMVVRTGMPGIVIGTGQGEALELANIAETADVKVGDFLVTSSLGNRFPEGHPVGIVQAIRHNPGERFAKIIVTPSAHIASSRHVLLIWTVSGETGNAKKLKKKD